MFSSDPVMNPLTYNWNKIYVGYCDGASFSGARKEKASNGLHYKGYFILGAVYSTFFDKFGMGEATEVIVSGTSAGGLSVFLHLDQIAELINHTKSILLLCMRPSLNLDNKYDDALLRVKEFRKLFKLGGFGNLKD